MMHNRVDLLPNVSFISRFFFVTNSKLKTTPISDENVIEFRWIVRGGVGGGRSTVCLVLDAASDRLL